MALAPTTGAAVVVSDNNALRGVVVVDDVVDEFDDVKGNCEDKDVDGIV